MSHLEWDIADPNAPDVLAVIERHLAFAVEVTPPGHVHALGSGGLAAPDVSLFALRAHGSLVAIGALRALGDDHGEIKSMHTAAHARGNGFGREVLDQLLNEARSRGYTRVSLETGTMEAFAPARTLYRSAGFEECAPFGDYQAVPNSVCMTLAI